MLFLVCFFCFLFFCVEVALGLAAAGGVFWPAFSFGAGFGLAFFECWFVLFVVGLRFLFKSPKVSVTVFIMTSLSDFLSLGISA